MNPTLNLSYRAMLIAGVLLTAPVAMAADPVVVQTEVRQTEALSASRGDSRVQTRLAGDFTTFAGSEENARNLFTGLRNGTPITLNSTTTSSGGVTTTNQLTVDTPTKPMGNGNVFISLALAKQQLASYGITNPTPQQIQAALTGGTINPSDPTAPPVELQGVLNQRAGGMGWGEIAKSQGTNLGRVVSGLKSHNAGIVTGTPVSTTNTGITTATGAPVQSGANVNAHGSAASANHGNSANAPGHNQGVGIVSATGSSLGGSLNTNANAQAGVRAGGVGAGIVTGGGAAATARGGANAQGHAKGLLRN
jgi:hypothetical protein